MSTAVIPAGADGIWEMASISPENAAAIVSAEDFTSAVGHFSSAEAMSAVLGVEVAANRITVDPVPGDQFLCLRLKSRPPEGVILTRMVMEMFGFGWALLSYRG